MKVTVLTAIVLLALCLSANGWWGGRRSSSSSSSSRSSGSSSSSSSLSSLRRTSPSATSSSSNTRSSRRSWGWGRSRKTDDAPSSTKKTGIERVKDVVNKAKQNVRDVANKVLAVLEDTKISIEAEVKADVKVGDHRVSGKATLGLEVDTSNTQKRSAQWSGNRYNITFTVDPCDFNTYDDIDGDGTIDKDEMHAIFGSTELTDALFADLDKMDDGIVTEEEFNDMAPVVISACIDTKK